MRLHVDQPLRLYAVDMRNRRVWGAAFPVHRLMVAANPNPRQFPQMEPRLFEPLATPLLPQKAEPRWKLWVRRDLRNPKAWHFPTAGDQGVKSK